MVGGATRCPTNLERTYDRRNANTLVDCWSRLVVLDDLWNKQNDISLGSSSGRLVVHNNLWCRYNDSLRCRYDHDCVVVSLSPLGGFDCTLYISPSAMEKGNGLPNTTSKREAGSGEEQCQFEKPRADTSLGRRGKCTRARELSPKRRSRVGPSRPAKERGL